jgi:hypothetical protein
MTEIHGGIMVASAPVGGKQGWSPT